MRWSDLQRPHGARVISPGRLPYWPDDWMKQTRPVLVLVARVVGCYRQHATRRRFSEIAQRMASLSPSICMQTRWLPSGDTKGWFEEACRATLNARNQGHHPRKMRLPGERISYFCHHRRRRRRTKPFFSVDCNAARSHRRQNSPSRW